jgi:hypothetical protein
MTVKELYELAKAMMFEKSTSRDYDNYYIPWINVLLSENFDINNSLLRSIGESPLDDIPTVSADTDVLPYEDRICREILPYGLAAHFFIDDDLSKYDIFNTKYENARMAYMKGRSVAITDVYEVTW